MTEMPKNVLALREMIRPCRLCPRLCGVDRTAGELGACQSGAEAIVASSEAHFGEEPVLVGPGGSGTIFFGGCNLACVFCQNHNISHPADPSAVDKSLSPGGIAELAMDMQRRGCSNVNFVTPTHVAHAVAEAIVLARRAGLTVPVVYNCGGYESLEALRLLDGLVEIYMPDFKYAVPAAGLEYSGVADYPAAAEAAVVEMYRQVGPLAMDEAGMACRGLLVRHLVLPNDLAASYRVIDCLCSIVPGAAVNVMGQYRPAYQSGRFPQLAGRVAGAEVQALREYAAWHGLRRVD